MYNRYYLITIFLLLFLRVQAQETIKVKQVESSVVANYENQRGGSSTSKLIDGKKAQKTPMWLDNGALGWQNKEMIVFDLELQNVTTLQSVQLSTAANESANALNPLSIGLFLSLDGVSYQYIENLADRLQDNIGYYRANTLQAKAINKTAKFIKLVVYPQGRLFFTDEIQVIGKVVNNPTDARLTQTSNVATISKQNVETEKNKALLLNRITNKKSSLIREIASKSRLDKTQYEAYSKKIAREGVSTSTSFSNTLTLKAINSPWNINNGNLTYYNNQNIEIVGVQNTSSYLLIEVANNTRQSLNTHINLTIPGNYKIYDLTKVATRDLKEVYDPLLPLNNNSGISLSLGEKKYFLLEIQGSQAGRIKGELSLGTNKSQALSFVINNSNLEITDHFIKGLNFGVNVWPYYTSKFYQGKELTIKEDLKRHHVNVLPLNSWTLGVGGAVNRKEILKNLEYRNENDIILLFLNQGNLLKNPGDYLQPSWMNRFLKWYDEVIVLLKSQNIPMEKVYLYPYDEVKPNEVKYFNTFVDNIKHARPEAQIYLTIFNGAVINNLSNQVDILQVVRTNNDFSTLAIKTKYWIYDIMDDAKSTDSFLRYRVQPWMAYYYDAEGVGFWNYADIHGASVWDDTDGGKGDYNAVYDYQNGIIPSIRWKAFKQGVEDYYILRAYEAKFGKVKLKNLMKPLIVNKTISSAALESLRTELIKSTAKN